MISDIRYVVLSDLHLGQDQSLLTHLEDLRVQPRRASPTLEALVGCLEALIDRNEGREPPTLILLGDALELALSELHISTMVLERFAELWVRRGAPLFGRVVYVPGNHDHHLWERARETAFIEHLRAADRTAPLAPAQHASSLLTGLQGGTAFLEAVLGRALGDHARAVEVSVHYPSLALRSPAGDRLALLDHGHYFEPLYHAMNTLQGLLFPGAPAPTTTNEIERENFAWIDFFWSTLGRQGPVGMDVERVYDALEFPDRKKRLVDGVVAALIARWESNVVERDVARTVAEWAVNYYLTRAADAERGHHDAVFSRGLRDGMLRYVQGPLASTARAELGGFPDDVVLVFGHTHKPFEEMFEIAGFGAPVHVYNTGGWVVDPGPSPQPLHGGAAVLLDAELHHACVRFYNETGEPAAYRVRTTQAGPPTAFSRRIASIVDAGADPYRRFSEAVSGEIDTRLQIVKRVLDGKDTGTQ